MGRFNTQIAGHLCRCDSSGRLSEGDFKHIEGKQVPQSSDIVFIVEAKSCNKDLMMKKNLQHLLNTLNKEAISSRFNNNRYEWQ